MRPNYEKTLLILFSGIIGLGLCFPSLSLAEMYKYVDENGVAHFTNVPDKRYTLVLRDGWVRFRLGANVDQYDPIIRKTSERYGVDHALVKAVIKAESNFDPQAISRAGAKGLMQIMPGTAKILGVNDSFHPADNIEGGVRHLRYLLNLFNGDLQLALAAYNAGEEAVFRYEGLPPYQETQAYVQRVLQYFQKYSSAPIIPGSSLALPGEPGG
ncbi:MAG TPA: lytic transglycosylase domain-containing protein [Thermodesulfobacteriota bacterium]|nr:lytic transglycosylase domain-containing protein [Thermodesulfobacteriota bacterium]